MPSVVIPAHNEAKVIVRCLASVLAARRSDEFEVVVVCNGCTDETASLARAHSSAIVVVETTKPSKSNALNLGDDAVESFPRMYLDADVELDDHALEDVFDALDGQVLAVSPGPRFDLSSSSLIVRMFYAAWTRMPFYNDSMIGGSGAYALSAEGRSRFGRFPDVISDDGYVRLHFKGHERRALQDARSTVRCPRRTRDLLRMMTRVMAGALQLRRSCPELMDAEETTRLDRVRAVLRAPHFWPCFMVYFCIRAIARLKARTVLSEPLSEQWARDESSRVGT